MDSSSKRARGMWISRRARFPATQSAHHCTRHVFYKIPNWRTGVWARREAHGRIITSFGPEGRLNFVPRS